MNATMKAFAAILVGVVTLAPSGCASRKKSEPLEPPGQTEAAVATRLRREPVPFPARTPYDAQAWQRDAYLDGYRDGWEKAVRGYLLRGKFSRPETVPQESGAAWDAGWRAGAKDGSKRWTEEWERRLKELKDEH